MFHYEELGRRSHGKGVVYGNYKEKGDTWAGGGKVVARETQAGDKPVEGASKEM